MSTKTISLQIETLLTTINPTMYQKSDEISLNPYKTIISALEQRIPQTSLDKFKLYYQSIEGKSLQELIDDEYFDIKQLIKDLKQITSKNNH